MFGWFYNINKILYRERARVESFSVVNQFIAFGLFLFIGSKIFSTNSSHKKERWG